MNIHPFCRTADGTTPEKVRLAFGSGCAASVICNGAAPRDRLAPMPGRWSRPILPGCRDIAGRRTDATPIGAPLGRSANRISGGRLTLDGETYRLALYEKRCGDVRGRLRRVSTIDLFFLIIAQRSIMKSRALMRRPA